MGPSALVSALCNRLQYPQLRVFANNIGSNEAGGGQPTNDDGDLEVARSPSSHAPSPSRGTNRLPKSCSDSGSYTTTNHRHPHSHDDCDPYKSTSKRPTPQAFPLLALPLDILHHLSTEHLPLAAQVALKLSCRSLYISLPMPVPGALPSSGVIRVEGDTCQGPAVRYAFEESREAAGIKRGKDGETIDINHGRGDQEGRTRCALCKALYPVSLFDRAGFVFLDVDDLQEESLGESGQGREERSVGTARTESMLNVRNRVCKWHDGRFQRTLKRRKRGSNAWVKAKEGWNLEEACMHCGAVLAWEKCDCNCQTCWKRDVWCFTRVLEEEEERVKEDVYLRWIF
ncbi:hypothetical protein BDV97DRAFT_372830 [Delphinella strobiligena]|nr:hypothetical protein BDV97DRAFT_372830 [Delphinella strobiligena]